jgi:uncharacterized protein YjiS (DUF1127 family)
VIGYEFRIAGLPTPALRWQQRASERSDLPCIDDRLLQEMDMTRRQAERAARKPFWSN